MSVEGGKVLIHEWKNFRFYINRSDHGPSHFHVYEHNREICEYDIATLLLKKGRADTELHNYVQGWGFRNHAYLYERWEEIAEPSPHSADPAQPMPKAQKKARRRKRKKRR